MSIIKVFVLSLSCNTCCDKGAIFFLHSSKKANNLAAFYTPRERSSGGYIEITLSVRLSVQIRVQPITFLWFDIALPYLAHGCITIRRCVVYIHDLDWMLTFDLQVNFIGFCHVFMSNL